MFRHLLSIGLASLVLAGSAAAQGSYPSQPVRIINAFPPGGGTDLAVRVVAEAMREVLGQPVIVENKPGANTVIALEEVYKAKPDGYTIFASNSTGTSALLLMRDKLSFNPDEGMKMVAPLADGPPSMHVANKSAPFNTFEELVAYAKANPGKVRYASPGTNSAPHLDVVLLSRKLKVDLVHIPQKGAGPMIAAVTNGDAHFGSINVGTAGPQLRTGDVKPIALNFHTRLKSHPDVRTMAELGHPENGTVLWHALWVHKDTPVDVTNKIFEASQKALKSAKVQELYGKNDVFAADLKTPADVAAWEKPRVDKLRKQAVEAGLLKP
jgi:tripartite-type tricarboxylate transporter receptor subunit TctC